MTKFYDGKKILFLSTPSARRATSFFFTPPSAHFHFYPRPPRGGRRLHRQIDRRSAEFLSTPSARRATVTDVQEKTNGLFLSTPSARRATSITYKRTSPPRNFYPRPPRGGRRLDTPLRFGQSFISIHALREEGDFFSRSACGRRTSFLSTPSARRATFPTASIIWKLLKFLSTPSARRATSDRKSPHPGFPISIHALREEGDCFCKAALARSKKFLSTPSARRATTAQRLKNVQLHYFYPRPPRGGRRRRHLAHAAAGHFYPRPPRGGRPSNGCLPSPL